MPHIEVDGTRVHFRAQGEGAPVVLLHGGGSSGAQWREVCGMLDGFRTITVDHFGHGGTDPWPGPPEHRTHEADARLVRAVMAHPEGAGGVPAHLVGHSFGGGIAMRLLAENPAGVRSLVLMEPMTMSLLNQGADTPLYEEYMDFARAYLARVDAGDVEEAWRRFLDVNNAPGTWDAMPETTRERMRTVTGGVYTGWFANFNHFTTLAEVAAVTLPTLVLHGEATHHRFHRMSEVLMGHLPNARHAVIPGAGHMSPLSHAQEVAALLREHLAAH